MIANFFSAGDLTALSISVKLASITAGALLVLGTPLAWWLASGRSRLRVVIEAVTALPLVLPPTVLGILSAAASWALWLGR
jgi:molybdate transport system permease protein